METFVIGIFIAFAVIFFAAMAFVAWLVFMIVRSLYRGIVGAGPKPANNRPTLTPASQTPPALKYFPVRAPAVLWSRCPHDRCRTPNPPEAQFCRRCGMNLVAAKVGASPTNGRVLARA